MSLRGSPSASVSERVVLEDRAQLGPLAVGVRRRGPACAALIRSRELEQLGVELLDRPRGGRRVDELLLDLLDLLGGVLVVVELVDRRSTSAASALAVGAVEDLLLAALQPLGAAHQRPVDRLRAGRQPALQDGEREADRVAALAVELLGAVHALADVGR